ncbi:hypothetical protein AU192_01305 [Mycobacterium lehmannii]|uniref:SF3 helicase domain-containing protein n=1 Tax=Mycobacterium lehmannii TaxID=2048550 RepID=A0A124ENQ1_9MYCO|nr:phage/plasmid primase, P4 family [Mycobacterium lehmannii]KUI11448.1 hypothetical protein AU192_01305 [Mycobacterium lehmannii]
MKSSDTRGTDSDSSEAESVELAEHLTGQYLLDVTDSPATIRVSELFGRDLADALVTWHRQQIGHGRYPLDRNGQETPNPCVADLLAVPVEPIAEFLADRGIGMPTLAHLRKWIEKDLEDGGEGIDPELELWRAREVADPDLAADPENPTEPRICGVPLSTYDKLQADEQRKVRDGLVIAPPQAPTFTARWLARHVFTARHRVPGQRRRAWMRTLVRIDQTWYQYAVPGAGGPARWIARTDPEWIRGRLRQALSGMFYVKTRQLQSGNAYSLKSWNPDDKGLTQVANALADLLSAGTGTQARELPNAYGEYLQVYRGGARVLCRNGVLDLDTGALTRNCPLWFSLSMVNANYDHTADPHGECEWLRMLRDQWADDPGAITCLQQWFGYVLTGRTDLQKWMLVIGPSGSGKSIIADVLGTLLGVVSATKLDTLNSQFGLQALYETGATLAVMSDIRFGARDSNTAVGNLLAITGEDEVTVERKYKTAVSARLSVRFHGSANEMPRWSDNSSALQRRALILETSRGFRYTDDDDPGLKRRILAAELGQVLRWAVEGLALLNASGGRFARSSHADELDAELSELSSPVRTFVNECCEIGTAEDFVDLKPLYTVWQGWAETNNTGKGMSLNKFRAALKALYLDPVKPGQKKLPDGKPGKWAVVWGIQRAQTTVISKGLNGVMVHSVVSTDPLGDPWTN